MGMGTRRLGGKIGQPLLNLPQIANARCCGAMELAVVARATQENSRDLRMDRSRHGKIEAGRCGPRTQRYW